MHIRIIEFAVVLVNRPLPLLVVQIYSAFQFPYVLYQVGVVPLFCATYLQGRQVVPDAPLETSPTVFHTFLEILFLFCNDSECEVIHIIPDKTGAAYARTFCVQHKHKREVAIKQFEQQAFFFLTLDEVGFRQSHFEPPFSFETSLFA